MTIGLKHLPLGISDSWGYWSGKFSTKIFKILSDPAAFKLTSWMKYITGHTLSDRIHSKEFATNFSFFASMISMIQIRKIHKHIRKNLTQKLYTWISCQKLDEFLLKFTSRADERFSKISFTPNALGTPESQTLSTNFYERLANTEHFVYVIWHFELSAFFRNCWKWGCFNLKKWYLSTLSRICEIIFRSLRRDPQDINISCFLWTFLELWVLEERLAQNIRIILFIDFFGHLPSFD